MKYAQIRAFSNLCFPVYRQSRTRIFPYLDKICFCRNMVRIVTVFSRIWTESASVEIQENTVRESPYFIIFNAVMNFICCLGPRNVFVILTSRFFSKPIRYCHIYIARNIDTVLRISSQMLNIYIILCILFCTHI